MRLPPSVRKDYVAKYIHTYRIFQAWLSLGGTHNLNHKYFIYQWHFLCSLCPLNYQNIQIQTTLINCLEITHFHKYWNKVIVWQPGSPKKEPNSCGTVKSWSIGMLVSKCRSFDIQTESILESAGLSNITEVKFGRVPPSLRKPRMCITSMPKVSSLVNAMQFSKLTFIILSSIASTKSKEVFQMDKYGCLHSQWKFE